MRRTEPHQSPVPCDHILSLLRKARKGPLLLCHGTYSPNPAVSERILIFEVSTGRLKRVFDGWLRTEDSIKFKSIAGEFIVKAECDAMCASPAKFVWATLEGVLVIWRNLQPTARIGVEVVELRTRVGHWKPFATREFTMCHAFLSDSWATRGVRLRRRRKKSVVVAKRIEALSFLDPTYDGLALMAETAWVSCLASAVASATGLPLKVHKYLG